VLGEIFCQRERGGEHRSLLENLGENSVKWPRDVLEIERVNEETGVTDLATSAAAHEPPKLLLSGAAAPGGHLLEPLKSASIAVGVDDFFDGGCTECANQLILQVGNAYVKAEPLHIHTSEVRAKTGALERPTKHRLLTFIAQTREPQASRPWAELVEEASDPVRASEPNNPGSRSGKVDAASLSQRFERGLITHALDNHDHADAGQIGVQIHRPPPYLLAFVRSFF
jgi:hypothetical protein